MSSSIVPWGGIHAMLIIPAYVMDGVDKGGMLMQDGTPKKVLSGEWDTGDGLRPSTWSCHFM